MTKQELVERVKELIAQIEESNEHQEIVYLAGMAIEVLEILK